MTTVVVVVTVGIGSAIVAYVGGRYAARANVVFDSDTIEARINWVSDAVAASSLVLSSMSVAVLASMRSNGLPGQALVAGGTTILAVLFLARLIRSGRHGMNGYPESQFPRLSRFVSSVHVVVPGVLLSILGQVTLVAAAQLWPTP